VDGLLQDRDAVALLKALGDTGTPRIVSWNKRLPEGIAPQFTTNSPLCLSFNQVPSMCANLVALLDRARIAVFAPSAEEVHRRVGEAGWLKNSEVRDFIGQNLDKIKAPSMRLYAKIEEEARINPDWRAWASRLLGQRGVPDAGQ
jgi:hypothetical protein